MFLHTFGVPRRRLALIATSCLAVLTVGLFTQTGAHGEDQPLPLGDADLVETRSSVQLAAGVTLTRIVRGDGENGDGTTPADRIDTTTRGPWRVNVLTIDPAVAQGRLEATYGPDLAQVERTSDLVARSRALVGVNASFFTFTADQLYPGDPVGVGVYGRGLASEPAGPAAEIDLVVNAITKDVLLGRLTWSGRVTNPKSDATLALEFLNHPPVVPAGCTALADQTKCNQSGDVVDFTEEFAGSTPSGPGVEVILDGRRCVVATYTSRGTVLLADQTSLQATGRESRTLLRMTKGKPCLQRTITLFDQSGRALQLDADTYGVNGRYQLTSGGAVVAPSGSASFFQRNPRTIAGTASTGALVLATIDGRQTTSVGTTLAETGAVAQALGMSNSVNLDGGGSTTMAVGPQLVDGTTFDDVLVNRPSGSTERAVGDALVYVVP